MKNVLKWVGIVLGGLVGLIAVAAIALYATGGQRGAQDPGGAARQDLRRPGDV